MPIAFAESIGLPPPRLTSPSCSPRIKACKPAVTASVVGSGTVSEKTPQAMPAFSICSRKDSASPIRTRTVSVTIRGRLIPRCLRMLDASAIAPPPILIIDGTRTSIANFAPCSFLVIQSLGPNDGSHRVLLAGLERHGVGADVGGLDADEVRPFVAEIGHAAGELCPGVPDH